MAAEYQSNKSECYKVIEVTEFSQKILTVVSQYCSHSNIFLRVLPDIIQILFYITAYIPEISSLVSIKKLGFLL